MIVPVEDKETGPVKVLSPVSRTLPELALVKEIFALAPSAIRPVIREPDVELIRKSAVPEAAELVIKPALVTEFAELVEALTLTPLRSRTAPWRMVRLTPLPRVEVAPESFTLPSLMVRVPVSALTAFRIKVPAPFLVMPPVVVEVTGDESVKLSEAPLTRITRSPAEAVVTPLAPVMEAPVVAPSTKMPPPVAPPTVSRPVSVRALLPEILSEVTERAPVEAAASIATFVEGVRVLTVVKPVEVPYTALERTALAPPGVYAKSAPL